MNYASFALKHLDVRTRTGHEWQCLCPYHDDTSPSFSVNVRKGLFVCYACGAKGRVESLSKFLNTGERIENHSSVEDVKAKAKGLLETAPVVQRFVAPEWLAYWRHDGLYRDKWATRSITADPVCDLFCLGYDIEMDALVIPVHDWHGKMVEVFRRYMDPEPGTPKYKYPRDFKIASHLYGAWQARTSSPVSRLPLLAVTEGSIDTLALWQAGTPSVALLGARLSQTQRSYLRALDPVEVLILTDRDTAGRQASLEIQTALRGSGIITSEPKYWPKGCKDVGEMSTDQIVEVVESAGRC